jgi:hypothetical protein
MYRYYNSTGSASDIPKLVYSYIAFVLPFFNKPVCRVFGSPGINCMMIYDFVPKPLPGQVKYLFVLLIFLLYYINIRFVS